MTLSAVVEKSGLNKPTVRRLLLALIRAGLLEQDDRDRRYYIGEEAYVLGTLASGRHGLLRLSTESLHRLAQKTSDSCFLSVRRGASSVCLHREEGSFPIRTHALQAGSVHPLGVGAGSLAMPTTFSLSIASRITLKASWPPPQGGRSCSVPHPPSDGPYRRKC